MCPVADEETEANSYQTVAQPNPRQGLGPDVSWINVASEMW